MFTYFKINKLYNISYFGNKYIYIYIYVTRNGKFVYFVVQKKRI